MEADFEAAPQVIHKKRNKLPQNPEAGSSLGIVEVGRFPSWLHRKLPAGSELFNTGDIIKKHGLNTVCEEAKCPNRLECYSKKTATFLVLGSACTRACGFCDIDFSKTPKAPDPKEAQNIVGSVKDLGLKHVVITMVARDDLDDGGASALITIVNAVKKECPDVTIELLTSDFNGNESALNAVLETRPEIFNHNIETVRGLTPRVRHRATYDRTLKMLRLAKDSGKVRFVKSGLMVGLGEKEAEVEETLRDLKLAGCDMVTIGQYLQASRLKIPVRSFVPPELFKKYEIYGKSIGLFEVYSGPFVRSSYNAADILNKMH